MFLSKSQIPFWSRLALHALWLHGVWEAVQCRLLYDMGTTPFTFGLVFMVSATGADVILTLVLVALALRLARGRRSRVFLTLAACGAIAAILIEILALAFGWWRYSPAMPALHFAGRSIGFFPVVQMTVLPSSAVVLARSLPSKSN